MKINLNKIVVILVVVVSAPFMLYQTFLQNSKATAAKKTMPAKTVSAPKVAVARPVVVATTSAVATTTPVIIATPDEVAVVAPADKIPEVVIATTTKATATTTTSKIIKLSVPFTSQAPLGEWSDSRQENGCEEASALMAVYWATGKTITPQIALDTILAISDWEQEKYGSFEDTSARDTVKRIFKGYFDYQDVEVVNDIAISDIIAELEKGNLVVVPANGQALKNKFFHVPGPEHHMLVIIGYDYQAKEFITNDPGTRNGKGYRYAQNVLFNAIRDYTTGYHEPIIGEAKNMIVVRK
jgi:hypothetical protein